jgi:predicted negative regulator of RcsB-dependent stress response
MVEKIKDLTTSQVLSVLQFQKQLQQGDFDKAASEIINLKRLRAPSAIINLLDGNLNYLKGNKRNALESYRRSFSQYNKNYEVKSLIEQLEKEVGR